MIPVDAHAIFDTLKPFDSERYAPANHFPQYPEELIDQCLRPLDDPVTVSASTAKAFLRSDDYVLGVTVNGKSRAYPLMFGNYYHQVNDILGGEPVLVND